MKRSNKNQKGITLIALVLTIIILIILAGVGISILTGEDGIIKKAKCAAQNYQSAADEEKNALDNLIYEIAGRPFIDNAGSTSFGTDTSNYDWSASTGTDAKLDLGETVNLRLKKIAALANGKTEEEISGYTVYNSEDTYITSIVWSNTEPTAAQKVNYGQLAMTPDSALGMDADGTTNELIVSDVPIYAWYENGTIYIWSSDTTIDMHPHSERMFQGMKNLQNISGLSHFVTDNVTSVRCMFKDTKISDFTVCNDWNVTNVKGSVKAGQESLPGNNGFYWMCNHTPSNSHPTFSERAGAWNNEGTFIPDVVYPKYTMGQELILLGEKYYVIEDSNSSVTSVKLLTEKPVRTSDFRQYDKADCPRFDDNSNDYATSEIAAIVTNYKTSLERRMSKTIEEARLMTYSEEEGLRTNGYTDVLYGTTKKWDYWIITNSDGGQYQGTVWRKS